MRSTIEIICAVKDCEPATEEELRLALVAESHFCSFYQMELNRLIEMVDESTNEQTLLPRLKLALSLWKGSRERLFQSHKTPVDKWLGKNHTPGTSENLNSIALAKRVFKLATGEDL